MPIELKTPAEIVTYNDETVKLGPTNDRQREFLKRTAGKLDPSKTETFQTWLELMDLDDRVTFERLWSGE